ncbi:Cu(I)/Ag(I) efflux system membrane fusion protein [Methylobacterium brachiatum]|uniref:Cu(I)/Ag(I) efflux system membrane fusion protein n=1 Tax=Methylobacterium brachiatum TaxID=269660 RepID=A0AAJ1TUL3_9HYPH|nr:efflux RND transporter periplasmic adaptor subunit [Methylobacterium brachiatum]MCB4801569.1 efflux RND transporter periplasmic adaptor subunit [Methylobacterium brachiatum]MDQ0544223.1 Cu(I)/Ag(I) efflux system membrane fusion protein [Methylobacterium brachiatum]
MSRAAWLAGTLAALAAGGAGYGAGRMGGPDPIPLFARAWAGFAAGPEAPPEAATGPVVYYQDPDGKPVYSLSPMMTEDGRLFRAVQASEDLRFDRPAAEDGSGQAGPGAGDGPKNSGRTVRYYRNPMGLPDTSPVPKKDSMGMDYIPVYDGDDPDPSTVMVSPGRVQRTGVRSAVVERRVVSRPVRVPGTVALDERRVTVVATRADAYVDHVEDVTTGDRVRQGQPLVSVYAPEINAAAAQLIANPGFDGARRRIRNLNVSEAVIAEMERTRTVPRAITWAAPRDGLVLERRAVEGMKAAAGDTLFRIADLSRIWVLADVPEHDLAGIRVGQAATVRVPGRSLTARVEVIYPQVNRETRSTRIRIELPNPDGLLLPDMYADVEIATGATEPVVAVPEGAVIETGSRQAVLIDGGEGRFAPRAVEIGRRGDGYVEIRAGLRAGERVVTAANFLIDAESNLKAALASLAAPPTDGEGGR